MNPERRQRIFEYYTAFLGDQLGVIEGVFFTELTRDMLTDPHHHSLHIARVRPVNVPEAPTVALCGLGVAGLMVWKRR